MLDVVVVGAGPAGATAARQLAGQGVSPLLLEKAAELPRERACGGVLTSRARKLAAGDASEPSAVEWVGLEDVTVSVPGSFSWAFDLPPGALGVISRPRLDHDLVIAAERAGTRVELGQRVEALESETGGGWRIRCASRTHLARHVILATGLRDPIVSSVGLGHTPVGMGLALDLELAPSRPAPKGLHIELGAHPNGWFWMCPRGRRCAAGLVSTRGRAPGARRLLNLFLERRGLAATGVRASATDLIPFLAEGALKVRPGLVPAGDALPAVDSLTGLGLEGALRSGASAARFVGRALNHGGPEPAAAMEKWRRRGVRGARAAARVGAALHGRPAAFLEVLRAQPERAVELGACLLGERDYAHLFGRWLPTAFERMLKAVARGQWGRGARTNGVSTRGRR